MKYVKVRKDMLYVVNPLLILTGILLFCFYPHAISAFFYAFWLCTAAVVFLIVTPYGNKRLTQNTEETTQRIKWQLWIFCILLLELTLIGIYAGIAYISSEFFPINIAAQTHLFSTSLHTTLCHLGLFPWTLYAITAVGMGVIAYCEQTNAFFSALVKPIVKNEPQEAWGLIVNIGMRRFTLFAVAITLLFMTFLFISLFLSPENHIAHGFHPAALLATIILFTILLANITKEYLHRIFSRRIPTALIFPAFTALLGIVLLVISMLAYGLVQHATAQSIPPIMTTWIHYHWHLAWHIFSILWWCALTPIVSAFIVRISKGYSIRAVLIGILLLPTAITLFFLFQNDFSLFTPSPLSIKIASLISFLILLPLLINHRNASFAILSYFPKEGLIKQRDEQPFFQHVVQLTIAALYFYLIIGINGLSLFLFAPNYFTLVTLLISSCAIVKNRVQS